MPQNLFAACRTDKQLVAKRVRLDDTVQGQVEEIFTKQEELFRENVNEEVPFDGSWKPNENEFLTIDIPQEAAIFEKTLNVNPTSIDDINVNTFKNEGIKSLFTGGSKNGATKVLIQRFTSQQMLEKKFALFLTGNAFRRLSDSAFTLDSSLTCIIEDGKIKFRSFQKLRSIIKLKEIYRIATDDEVRYFANHNILEIMDVENFVSVTNESNRKLIHSIMSKNILTNVSATSIKQEALRTDLTVNVQNDKIIMPTKTKEINDLLLFLNEMRFPGPFSGQTYITNSRRPIVTKKP